MKQNKDVPAVVTKKRVLAAMESKPVFKGIHNLKKRAFLVKYSESGRLFKAAKAAKIHWTSHYIWLKRDKKYVEAFAIAVDIAADRYEDEVRRRGFEGFDTPVIYKGKIMDRYKEYSDNLAMFSLKGLRPNKYRDSAPPLIGGPTQFNITFTNQPTQRQRSETEKILQSKVT